MTRVVTPGGNGIGWAQSLPDPRDKVYATGLTSLDVVGGLTPDKLPHIWNQLQLGSCTAHGSLRAFIALCIKLGIKMPAAPKGSSSTGSGCHFSRLEQYYNTRSLEGTTTSDSGAQVRDAIKALSKFGVGAEADWEYDVTKFATQPPQVVESGTRVHKELEYKSVNLASASSGPRSALSEGYPVVFGFNVPDYFEDGTWDPSSGAPLPIPTDSTSFIGGHCVCATYYDFSQTLTSGPYWTGRMGSFYTIDNSWDTSWGFGGRFNMDAEWFNPTRGLVSDLWIITDAK